MGCELIVVGDELLEGRAVDINSAIIARRLAQIGIKVNLVVRVGDEPKSIQQALAESLIRSRLIFVVGGLGPTSDDRTLEAVCELLNRRLILNKETREKIQRLFRQRGEMMPKFAERQALIPNGAEVVQNPVGMVPGMILRHQDREIILLPGVPQELKALLDEGIIGYLKKNFSPPRFYQELIRTFGLIESQVAPRVEAKLKAFSGIQVGYYPSVSGLDLFFSGPDKKALKRCADEIVGLFPRQVYAREERNLAEVVGELLRKNRLTVATAESCTGGRVGDFITNISGSSDYYLGGVVAYSNDVKMKILGVRPSTLKRYGAVSSQTVGEMVLGVMKLTGSECGIATSGIAGPTGGSRNKPVGLVYIGTALKDKVQIERYLFTGNRELIKDRSGWTALDQLRRMLTKNP